MRVAFAALALAGLPAGGCYRSHERPEEAARDAEADVVGHDAELPRCVSRALVGEAFGEMVGPIAPFPAHGTRYVDTQAAWHGAQLVLGSWFQLVGPDGRAVLPPAPAASRGVVRILGDGSDCYAEREVLLSPDPGGPIGLTSLSADGSLLLASSDTEGFVFGGPAGARSLLLRLSGLPLTVFGEAVVTPGGEILGVATGERPSMLAWDALGAIAHAQELPVRAGGYVGLGRSADRFGVVDDDLEGTRSELVFYERDGTNWREVARLDAPHLGFAALHGHFDDDGNRALATAHFRPERRAMFPANPGTLLLVRRGADRTYRLNWLDVGASIGGARIWASSWAGGARIARVAENWDGTGAPFVLVEDLLGDTLMEVFRWTPEPVPPCTGGVRVTALALSPGDERLAVSVETECLPGELDGWDAIQATFVFE